MPLVSAAEVRKQIAAGRPAPVYLVIGDDETGKAEVTSGFADLVEPDLRAFNVERFYGDEPGAVAAAVASASTLPMLGSRRLVVLLRLEKALKGRRRAGADEGDGGDGAGEPLLQYLAAPGPETTFVLVAADVNRTTRLGKALYRQASVIECWGLKDGKEARAGDLGRIARKAEAWVRQATAAAGVEIERDAVRLLAGRAGAHMDRLRADVQAVLLYAAGRPRITLADVDEVVGAETAQDDFAIVRAIEQGRPAEALRQLALAFDAGAVPYMLLGQLGWFVREGLPRVDAVRVPAAVEAVFRTDLDLKSSAGDPRVLLERLVVELCGGGGPAGRPGRPLRGA